MAYNTYYPAMYQAPMQAPQSYQQYQQPAAPQMSYQASSAVTQPQNTGITWVQGEIGAKAYPVQAGCSVLLMDSEDQRFFIKSTDASGMPLPLRTFTYMEEVGATQSYAPPAQDVDMSKYITREELEERLAERSTASQKADVKRGKANAEQSV